MTLFRFDDTSLDATRRSIFLYAFISFVVYRYNPSWKPNDGLGRLGFEFHEATITSHSIAGVMVLVLSYLLIRFLVLLPIHRSAKSREFRDLRDRVETNYKEIQERQKSISSRQDALHESAKSLDHEEIINLVRQNQLDWKTNVPNLLDRLRETSTRLEEYANRLSSEDAHRKRLHYDTEIDTALRDLSINTKTGQNAEFKRDFFLETEISKRVEELRDALSKAKPIFSLVIAGDPVHDKLARSIEQERRFIQGWNDFVETHLSQIPAKFHTEDVSAKGRSEIEVLIFGTFVPLTASTLGLAFALESLFLAPSDRFSIWFLGTLFFVALIHIAMYFFFGKPDPEEVGTKDSQLEQARENAP